MKKQQPSTKAEDPKKPTGLPPGFSTSPTKNTDPISRSLSAIYGLRPGTAGAGDLATFERSRGKAWVVAIIGSLVFLCMLAGVAWAGFWWWSGVAQGAGLQVAIEGPTRVSVGQETTFYLNWLNRGREPLSSAELRVAFPADFVMKSVDPVPAGGSSGALFTVDLGARPAEARGTIKVIGAFTGALNTKTAIQVIGTSRLASQSQDQELLSTHDVEYADSVLEGALEVPAKVLPGDRITLSYHVRNKGENPVTGLEARIKLPDGFVRDGDALGELLDGNIVRLPIGDLPADTSSTLRLAGAFALGTHGDAAIHAEAGRVFDDGAFAPAQTSDATVSVLPGDLSVKLVVNGSDQSRSAAPGERQRIAVSYDNMSGEELGDVELRVRFAGATRLVDWDELDDPLEGRQDDDAVIYDAETVTQLDRLPEGGTGLIELSVPLIGSATSGMDLPLEVMVDAIIGKVGNTKVNRTVTTQPIVIKLQTDAELDSSARYASEEGAPVGRGPLPPIVATGTTYRIEWTVTKSLHALERVTVSANLPKAVSFTAIRENGGGQVAFDADRRLVTWKVDGVPADARETVASFDVTLVPSEADAGRFAQLLGEARFEFTDAALGEPLLRTAPALSTDLPDDTMAKGKGVVKKP